ncbi:toll/interleukin-1 receptor domain-containing protein [Geodermatophilus sp. SYSU D00710]
MAHDVFISYCSRDKPVADAVCGALEEHAVRCWTAHRDAPPGEMWSEAIVAALEQCGLLVVVFSAGANASKHMVREVERAVHLGIPVLPLRIEDVEMGRSFQHFLGVVHWLDAITPPFEQHLDRIVESVAGLIKPGAIAQTPASSPSREGNPQVSIRDVPPEDWSRRRPIGRLRRLFRDR